jgi:glucokinase
MLILSGDVGGTKSRLQLTEFHSENSFERLASAEFLNHQFESFPIIVAGFLQKNKVALTSIDRACFAVAGPIIEGVVKFTNLPWVISETDLRDELGFHSVKLINDFEAVGYGIDTLKAKDIHCLQAGTPLPHKTRAMLGAGTGLGVAIAVSNGERYTVIPTEGGHVDFAPTDDTQIELLRYLRKKWHRVSIERLVSGQGIVNIYHFVRDNPLFNETENPKLKLALAQKNEDAAAHISEFAIKQNDPMAMRALDLFIRIYGACAGNLALTTLPYSGLYIVGGIAPKLLKSLGDGRFLQAYNDKGRMSNLLANLPIYVVMDTNVGLQGAANYAYGALQ